MRGERGRERERERGLLELSGSLCITEAICCSTLVKRVEMLQLVQMASEQKFGARAALCLVDVHILASRQVPAQPMSSMAYRAPVTSYQAASGWFSCLCNKNFWALLLLKKKMWSNPRLAQARSVMAKNLCWRLSLWTNTINTLLYRY